MNINFTDKEYRLLLDLIYMGTWVLTANEVERYSKVNHYDELAQKIYALAKDFGCEQLIEYDEEHDEYLETVEFEESEVMEFLEDFEEFTFWETLISRMAERDFLKELPPGSLESLSSEEKFIAIQKHEDKWADEFQNHGIDNLTTN